MAQSYISMSTKNLMEHGGEKAVAELQRRADNGSRYAGKALEELGATVNINGQPASEAAAPELDAILALLGQLGIDTSSMKPKASPAPAKPKSKKKPKKSNTTTFTGANIQRTRDDEGWTWECLGVWDKDAQAVDDEHPITGHTGIGVTNEEAKAAFYAPFKEQGIYLARPYYNDVKDYRTNPLVTELQRSSNVDIKDAIRGQDREAMKAYLGLPTSDSKHTDTLVSLCTKKLNGVTKAPTPTNDDIKASIANLLERFGK